MQSGTSVFIVAMHDRRMNRAVRKSMSSAFCTKTSQSIAGLVLQILSHGWANDVLLVAL